MPLTLNASKHQILNLEELERDLDRVRPPEAREELAGLALRLLVRQ